MAGIFIYKSAEKYYSFFASDDRIYNYLKRDLSIHGAEILWEKENVRLEKIEKARKTKETLVAKLNLGEAVDLKKELDLFF